MKAYLSTFSDAAEAKGKPLQPQQCCENYISFPVSDRTFSFGARLTPLNLASLEKNKQTSLWLLVINPIRRHQNLRPAPSPSGKASVSGAYENVELASLVIPER